VKNDMLKFLVLLFVERREREREREREILIKQNNKIALKALSKWVILYSFNLFK